MLCILNFASWIHWTQYNIPLYYGSDCLMGAAYCRKKQSLVALIPKLNHSFSLLFSRLHRIFDKFVCRFCSSVTSTTIAMVFLSLSDLVAAQWVQVCYSKIYPRGLFKHLHMKHCSLDSYCGSQWLDVVKQRHLQIPGVLQTASSRQANWCPLHAIIG